MSKQRRENLNILFKTTNILSDRDVKPERLTP